MTDVLSTRNVLLSAAGIALACSALAQPAHAQSATYAACYVPQVGAMYLIKRAGLPATCLAPAHVEVAWMEAGSLPDGSVTVGKLAFDPATQTELNALATALQSAGTINAAANPVDWTKLKNVPAGLAAGVVPILAGSVQWDIPSVAPATCVQQTFFSVGANIDMDPVLVMVDDNFPNGLVVRAVDAVQNDAIELVACNVTAVALDPVEVPFYWVAFNRP